MAYAENTAVSPERSQAEIAKLLLKYGANGFTYGWDNGRAQVAFRAHDRIVRFAVPLPNADERRFRVGPTGRARTNPEGAYEQEVRRRWRAMVLVIKAKLEAVETGVADFESEFLAYTVLPDGSTVADQVLPRVAQAYEMQGPVDLLPGLPAAKLMKQLDQAKGSK